MSVSTTMIMTIVPPIGPPIPILVGRAIRSLPNSTFDVFLKPEFEKAKTPIKSNYTFKISINSKLNKGSVALL